MTPRARAALVVGGLVVLLGLALFAMSTPDTGPAPRAEAPAPDPTDPRVAPIPPSPSLAGAPSPEPVPIADPVPLGDTGETLRAPEPFVEPPLDRVYRAELHGLAEAALARRNRFRDCWTAYAERAGGVDEDDGRFTIQLTVTRGDAGNDVEAAVVSGSSDAELERCVDEAVADARFEPPDVGQVSMVWPVPLSTLPGEP